MPSLTAMDLLRLGAVAPVEANLRWRHRHGPPFYSAAQFPWAVRLRDRWLEIREEFDRLWAQRLELPTPEQLEGTTAAISSSSWRLFVLRDVYGPIPEHEALCPTTARLLAEIPGLTLGMFSVFAGPMHIKAHRGYTKCVLRGHLPLRVPEPPGACRLRVGRTVRPWREGDLMIFDDTFEHEAWQETDGTRAVLLFDFQRSASRLEQTLAGFAMTRLANTSKFRDYYVRSRRQIVLDRPASPDAARSPRQ
jgi:ornithine lipid ester-linked acyl 2-hydroxylase